MRPPGRLRRPLYDSTAPFFVTITLWCALAGAAALAGVVQGAPRVEAAPQAGPDVLPVVAIADVTSALGPDSIILTGWIRVERSAPRQEAGVQVEDIEIAELQLRGASRLGAVTVTERPTDGREGEVRSRQPGRKFPASSFLDLLVTAAIPDSPFGSLVLYNEATLHLTPRAGGGEVSLEGWPPLGVTYGLDANASCIPLAGSKLGFCAHNLSLQVAPELPSFSVARGGPSRLHPADILALTPNSAAGDAGVLQAPFVRIACANLGLTPDGCDDGADRDQDDLDALSYGNDLSGGEGPAVEVSVGPGAQGAAGTAVRTQRDCPPARPGLAPEPEPDVFASRLDGANSLLFDGNGPVGTCPSAFPLGLVEGATVRDNLDALDSADPSAVDMDGNAVPDRPVYFSLDAASPSLAALGFTAADALKAVNGAAPSVYASGAALGLSAGDDLDALCLRESGDGAYGPGDVLYFSLAPGSPTLARMGAGPGDVLAPGMPPVVVQPASSLGLEATDNVDALACRALPALVRPNGDVNCSGEANSIDAVLVLQLGARLIDSLPCNENADVNEDRAVNSIDATLILQFDAGLINRLPVLPCLLPERELCG